MKIFGMTCEVRYKTFKNRDIMHSRNTISEMSSSTRIRIGSSTLERMVSWYSATRCGCEGTILTSARRAMYFTMYQIKIWNGAQTILVTHTVWVRVSPPRMWRASSCMFASSVRPLFPLLCQFEGKRGDGECRGGQGCQHFFTEVGAYVGA